jgi:hypothetical protein
MTSRLAGTKLAAHWVIPSAVSVASVAIAWLVGHLPHDPLAGGLVGLAAGEAALLVGLWAVNRPALRDARALISQGFGSLRPSAKRPAP